MDIQHEVVVLMSFRTVLRRCQSPFYPGPEGKPDGRVGIRDSPPAPNLRASQAICGCVGYALDPQYTSRSLRLSRIRSDLYFRTVALQSAILRSQNHRQWSLGGRDSLDKDGCRMEGNAWLLVGVWAARGTRRFRWEDCPAQKGWVGGWSVNSLGCKYDSNNVASVLVLGQDFPTPRASCRGDVANRRRDGEGRGCECHAIKTQVNKSTVSESAREREREKGQNYR